MSDEQKRRAAMLAEVVAEYEPIHADWKPIPRYLALSSRNEGRSHAIEAHDTEADALRCLVDGVGDWFPCGVIDLDTGAMAETEPQLALGEWVGTFEPEGDPCTGCGEAPDGEVPFDELGRCALCSGKMDLPPCPVAGSPVSDVVGWFSWRAEEAEHAAEAMPSDAAKHAGQAMAWRQAAEMLEEIAETWIAELTRRERMAAECCGGAYDDPDEPAPTDSDEAENYGAAIALGEAVQLLDGPRVAESMA